MVSMITAVLCSNDKPETEGRSVCMTTWRVCAHRVCHTCTLYTKGMTECREYVHTVCNAHYVQHMQMYVHTHTQRHSHTIHLSHSHTHTHTACTHLQYCSILQCHHEEVEPPHHTPTHGRNVTARHLHQLRTCYYLTTWLPVINATIGILSAVEWDHEHALAHNTLVHTLLHINHLHTTHCRQSICSSTLSQFTHSHFKHLPQV